ncbi:hypothetical protein FRC12_007165 [Ceratobasidium sp. 428]|nr:hypothetical protein FRC12_007165 [Ceratobasidium sp. 428]
MNSSSPTLQYVVQSDTEAQDHVRRARRREKRPRAKSVSDGTPSPENSQQSINPLTWSEEVERAMGDGEGSLLPEDGPWVNPDWSRSNYMSAPTRSNDESAEIKSESVELNAFIYKVEGNYVLSDSEYADVLRSLRSDAQSNGLPSQTSGAGPSSTHNYHRVTVEEIEDVDAPSIRSFRTISDASVTTTGKGKKKASHKKKKKKRTKAAELGVEVDELKRSTKKDDDRRARRRSSGKFDTSNVERTPPGFKSGGYLELVHGHNARRAARAQPSRETKARLKQYAPDSRPKRAESEADSQTKWPKQSQKHGSKVPDEPSDSSGSDSSDSTRRNDSSDTESSESSSESSSDEDVPSDDEGQTQRLKRRIKLMQKKQRQLERKLLTQARSGFKAQTPKSFNGEADFDKFELFVFNYDNWCQDTKLSTPKRVRNISRFLEGKASTWYMSNVAPNLNSYDMKSVYQGIFDYCFPPDFKENLRRKYMRKLQGDQSVQDYFAELDLMRRRLKVSDSQHVHRAYDGSARYIKGEWAIMGILPEDTTIDELRTTAIDLERAHKIRKSIEGQDGHRHKKDRSRSPDRRHDKRRDQKHLQTWNLLPAALKHFKVAEVPEAAAGLSLSVKLFEDV